MLGSPHARAFASPRAEFGASLNSFFCVKTLSFCDKRSHWTEASSPHNRSYSFICFERLSSAQFWFDNQQKRKYFLTVGRSFHYGRRIANNSKHHCEGNICLKEIVSNTRLDLQTVPIDCFHFYCVFPANNSS